jgi:hypothetical protein
MGEIRVMQGLKVKDLSSYRQPVVTPVRCFFGPWQYNLILQGKGPEVFTEEIAGHRVRFLQVRVSSTESVYVGWPVEETANG